MLADISENIFPVFCRDINFIWNRFYKECCTRKQTERTAWLLAGVWKCRGM